MVYKFLGRLGWGHSRGQLRWVSELNTPPTKPDGPVRITGLEQSRSTCIRTIYSSLLHFPLKFPYLYWSCGPDTRATNGGTPNPPRGLIFCITDGGIIDHMTTRELYYKRDIFIVLEQHSECQAYFTESDATRVLVAYGWETPFFGNASE